MSDFDEWPPRPWEYILTVAIIAAAVAAWWFWP